MNPEEALRDKDQGALQISGLWSLAGKTALWLGWSSAEHTQSRSSHIYGGWPT